MLQTEQQENWDSFLGKR